MSCHSTETPQLTWELSVTSQCRTVRASSKSPIVSCRVRIPLRIPLHTAALFQQLRMSGRGTVQHAVAHR